MLRRSLVTHLAAVQLSEFHQNHGLIAAAIELRSACYNHLLEHGNLHVDDILADGPEYNDVRMCRCSFRLGLQAAMR